MTKRQVTVEEWITQFSRTMALELVHLIDSQREERGPEVAKAVTGGFLAAFITAATIRSLGSRRAGSGKEQYDAVSDSFAEHKSQIQEAIAAGFSSAMSEFTGKSVEYYCLIKPVPDAISKSVN